MRWVILLTICQVLAAASFDLDAVRWQNRVLLVFDSHLSTQDMRQQRKDLVNDSCGLTDRHLTVATVGGDSGETLDGQTISGKEAAELRRRFDVTPGSFAVLLIGKDGGVKLRKTEPVKRQEIYGLIDQMPMRIREARATKAACDSATP